MISIRIFLITLALLTLGLVPAQAATQAETRSLEVSDVLYPASRSWPLISASPVLPADKRAALKDELERAYRAALKKELEETGRAALSASGFVA